MGIYDRDYYRQERPGLHLRMPTTMIGLLILINVAVWLPGFLVPAISRQIIETAAVQVADLARPWYWWRFLTYGFVHAPGIQHLLFNMLALFFLGRDVELVYGRKEFVWLYLVMLVVGSVLWAGVTWLDGRPGVLFGASGAVTGVVILFALHFPRRMLLLFFILPVPAWLVGVGLVVINLLGMVNTPDTGVAYVVHLTGAAFAFLYYHFHWHIGNWIPGSHWFPAGGWFRRGAPRPKLRIHDPREERERLSEEVDRILEKISREGESSLTRKERRTLENASREYQRRRHANQDSSPP